MVGLGVCNKNLIRCVVERPPSSGITSAVPPLNAAAWKKDHIHLEKSPPVTTEPDAVVTFKNVFERVQRLDKPQYKPTLRRQSLKRNQRNPLIGAQRLETSVSHLDIYATTHVKSFQRIPTGLCETLQACIRYSQESMQTASMKHKQWNAQKHRNNVQSDRARLSSENETRKTN